MVARRRGCRPSANGKAVAIVGDESVARDNEISTAGNSCRLDCTQRRSMCHQGMALLGLRGADAAIPQTGFVMIASRYEADDISVKSEPIRGGAGKKALVSNASRSLLTW